MKFSIIIPTFNKKNFLMKTLEALNHFPGYGREDYEVVVADDGSTDALFKAIKGINRNYRLTYIYLGRCKDSCRSRARNYGISISKGRYLVFLDDDMVVPGNYLKELERCYRVSDNLVVTGMRLNCPSHLIDETDIEELKRTACREAKIDVLEIRHLVYNCFSYNPGALRYPWILTFSFFLVIPRALLLKVGGFDENFKKWGGEDVELGYRLFKEGAKTIVNSRLQAFHQSHPIAEVGEDNLDYLADKCGNAFKKDDPFGIFSIGALGIGDPSWMATYRKYPGKIGRKTIINFRSETELEGVKKKIVDFSKKKGTEIIVYDYLENTDLDIWIQTLEVKNVVISYFPQSLRISDEKSREIVLDSLKDKILIR